jgi:hypothetical protein
MGYANAALIRACVFERKKDPTSEAFKQAAAAVDKSQAECPHPEEDRGQGSQIAEPGLLLRTSGLGAGARRKRQARNQKRKDVLLGSREAMILFKRIVDAWGQDTCSLGTIFDGPAGQCAVTALVVQDYLGGVLLRAVVPGYGSHYWNGLPGIGEIDLTRAQFASDLAIPRGEIVPRSRLLEGEQAHRCKTLKRYEILRQRACRLRAPT